MSDEDVGASHRRRRLAALVATATAIVGLATGVLTLRDQLFPREESSVRNPEGASTVIVPPVREVQRFAGIAAHFEQSRAFIEFLIAHDEETVLLDVSFRVADQVDGGALGFPPTTLKTDCDPGATPGSEFCSGVQIIVRGKPNRDTLFGVAHGSPVLEGYFAVDVSSREFMGIRGILLEPRTRKQATADL